MDESIRGLAANISDRMDRSLMQTHDIHGFSHDERHGLLPLLTTAFAHCGGWVLERNTLSATAMEFRVEIQLRSILELYGTLVASGLELTRSAHATLADLCTCRRHLPRTLHADQILSIRLEVNFLEDFSRHACVPGGAGTA